MAFGTFRIISSELLLSFVGAKSNAEGLVVGDIDGEAEGDAVGLSEGEAEGDSVGLSDGEVEGEFEGDAVGGIEGAIEGDDVKHLILTFGLKLICEMESMGISMLYT